MNSLSNLINVLHSPTLFICLIVTIIVIGLIIFFLNSKSKNWLIYFGIAFLLVSIALFSLRFVGLELAVSLSKDYANIINSIGQQILNIFLIYAIITFVISAISFASFFILKKRK